MRKICKIDRGLFMSESLIRKDYLLNGNNRLIPCYEPEYNFQSFSIRQDCDKLCKVECNDKYYLIEFEKIEYSSENTNYIRHNEYPDIFVKHIPEMNLIGFICNFGGLLGMWLGLSLFGIFNDTYTLFTKIDLLKYIHLIKTIYKTNVIKVTNIHIDKFISSEKRISNRINNFR